VQAHLGHQKENHGIDAAGYTHYPGNPHSAGKD
jgi:hypothetical protein